MLSRIFRLLFILAVAFATLYLADWAVLKLRKNPTGLVLVHPYTAVPQNNKREQLLFDDPFNQPCVNSLLPHQGMAACWYLRRHTQLRRQL